MFMKCFDHVSNTIDEIYKSLARNQSAQVIERPLEINCVSGKVASSCFKLSFFFKTILCI